MLQTFLKFLPLASGILLTILLPFAIKKSTYENATEENITSNTTNSLDTLDWFLAWRDLIGAIYTGIFVLQFSAATAIGSNKSTLGNLKLSDLAMITVILVSFILLVGWIMLNQLKVYHIHTKSKRKVKYWLIFLGLVIPWYFISFFFVYNS